MTNRYSQRQRVRLGTTVKNIATYGGLGMAAGIIICVAVLLIGQTFNSETTFAKHVDATVTNAQYVCLGDSVLLQATGGDYYSWSPREGLSNDRVACPSASPKNTTLYTATVFKKIGMPLRMSGVLKLSAALLNGRERTLQRVATEVKTHQSYLVTLQARATGYLDKGTLQIRVNDKVVSTYNISNRYTKPLQIIWDNKNDEQATLTLYLLDYDGDGETIECNAFDFQAVAKTELVTRVAVNKDCKSLALPTKPFVVNIDAKQVKLEWDKADQPLMVRYKRADDDNWKYIEVKGKSVLLKDLSGLYDYDAQVACVSKNDTGTWTPSLRLYSSDRLLTVTR